MSLSFLIPLTVGLGALSIYLRWMDEGAPIFGLAALIGLLTALVLAPWQVQALLLLSAVGLARYLLQQRSLPLAEPETAAGTTADVADLTTGAPGLNPEPEPNPKSKHPKSKPEPPIAPPHGPRPSIAALKCSPPIPRSPTPPRPSGPNCATGASPLIPPPDPREKAITPPAPATANPVRKPHQETASGATVSRA